MDKLHRLLEIIETYKRFEAEFEARDMDFGKTSSGGFWTATRWDHLIPFLEYALKKEIIQPNRPIVDAGSGDGRVSAVLDVYGFNPIINIELDDRLVKASNDVIDDLVQRGIVSDNIQTVHGDFTTSEAYNSAGVPFGDIPYFYTGMSSKPLGKLADKIKRESQKGTRLIVYGLFLTEDQKPKLPLQLENNHTINRLGDFFVYKK